MNSITKKILKKAYQKLSVAFDEYQWIDKDRVGLKFGYISNKLIQAVTSQKYGLDKDFTYYIHNEFYNKSAAINAGIDLALVRVATNQ